MPCPVFWSYPALTRPMDIESVSGFLLSCSVADLTLMSRSEAKQLTQPTKERTLRDSHLTWVIQDSAAISDCSVQSHLAMSCLYLPYPSCSCCLCHPVMFVSAKSSPVQHVWPFPCGLVTWGTYVANILPFSVLAHLARSCPDLSVSSYPCPLPILPCPVRLLPCPVPILHCPLPTCVVLPQSSLAQGQPLLFRPIPDLQCPVLLCPALSCSTLPCPVLCCTARSSSWSVPSCLSRFCPAPYCPVLSGTVLVA